MRRRKEEGDGAMGKKGRGGKGKRKGKGMRLRLRGWYGTAGLCGGLRRRPGCWGMLIAICECSSLLSLLPTSLRPVLVQEGGGWVRGCVGEWVSGERTVTDSERMAYIDSELARRRHEELARAPNQNQNQDTKTTTTAALHPPKSKDAAEKNKEIDVQRQPAALGKLLEIDLGAEARAMNVERTEQARRRMAGEEVDEEAGSDRGKGKGGAPVRLGRDGKPWRGRKRRGSEDIKRDKLVEDVLRENRCKSLQVMFCAGERLC